MTVQIIITTSPTTTQSRLDFKLPSAMEIYRIYARSTTNDRLAFLFGNDDMTVPDLGAVAGNVDKIMVDLMEDEFLGIMLYNEALYKDFDPIKIVGDLTLIEYSTATPIIHYLLYARPIILDTIPLSTLRESFEDRKNVEEYRFSERDEKALLPGEAGYQIHLANRRQVA